MRLSEANDFAGYLQEMAVEMQEAGLESTAEDYVKAASTITDLTGLAAEMRQRVGYLSKMVEI
tara:strand:+ start:1110 stop:1298 length:189 start_codon:yes stop_codon:yes gene_type:complete